MTYLDRRTLLLSSVSFLSASAFGGAARGQETSTLTGDGKSTVEKYLSMQEGIMQNTRKPNLVAPMKAPRTPANSADRLLMWNEIALDANARDYVPTENGTAFHVQFGPHRSSRAMAIVQLAVFEAVNAKLKKFKSWAGFSHSAVVASIDAAIAQAAHDALAALYPPQLASFDAVLADDLVRIAGTPNEIAAGRMLGRQAASAVLSKRSTDKSDLPEPSIPSDYQPSHANGAWDVDPISKIEVALGANWGKVTPFTLDSQGQFRAPPPPVVGSAAYSSAFNKTKQLGGDSCRGTKTDRTDDQTFTAKFWSYDGTPGLCAPPRLYNQLSRQLALAHGIVDVGDLSRFLAIINIAMADAAISAWEAKYFYKFWRPITAIRSANSPNNDAAWYPLGAQATNTVGPNITPPFPAYPSGHATFGGALFTILGEFVPKNKPFSFTSDEFNGSNKDAYGYIRPQRVAHFKSLSDAETSNAESRILDGVHWQFDGDAGIVQGRLVAKHVLKHFALASNT